MTRWIYKLVLFIILGTTVNVAMVWVCAVRPYPGGGLLRTGAWPGSEYEWRSPEGFETNIWKRTGELRITQSRFYIPGIPIILIPQPQKIDDLEYYNLLPYWSAFNSPEIDAMPDSHYFEEQSAGWPLLCMRFDRSQSIREYIDMPYSLIDVENGMLKMPWESEKWRNEIPIHPIWPGFAFNTIFYAAILWLIALAPFAARRYIRNKRGLCIKCGYDLRGTEHEVCPECGH